MRFVIARMNHETNTFSPLETPLRSFDPQWDDAALKAARGANTAMGAFVAYAEAAGATLVTPVHATAFPSGPVAQDAYEQMCAPIIAEARRGCDAILLDLHGAMVTEALDDGEGELLERLRAAVGDVPIGVALDLHANVSRRMVAAADVLVGFKTYPHVDMLETGQHAAALIDRILKTGRRPAMALRQLPILAQTLRMNTGAPGAMQDAIAAARAVEKMPGVQAVSVFGGFPLADIPDAGMSVVVVAEDETLAETTAAEVADTLWAWREEFIYREEPLGISIARAAAIAGKGPVLLLDHGDNCMSGGTCDTMDVVAEALRQGLDNIVAGPICDPGAVAKLFDAGVGAEVRLGVGNCRALPGIGVSKPPLALKGIVRTLSDGRYVVTGPTYTGLRCSMGRAAVLDTGRALILISERPHEPWDIGVFTCAGIDPAACRYLILKSRMYCRPVFQPMAHATIECASLGVTSSDLSLFGFGKLQRPIYPLDPDAQWRNP